MLRSNQLLSMKKFLTNPPSSFKILILTPNTLQILSHSYHQSDLRTFGITTLFDITSIRNTINIPAIYFVEPTQENLKYIVKDIIANKYNGYFINFTTHIPRKDLKALGYALNEHKLANQILSVWDQHINFMMLREYLFVYGDDGIFSVFFTLNNVPFIVSKNKEAVLNYKRKFQNSGIHKKAGQRPLLIIVDRDADVFTPIRHTWTYNSLICDLLGSCNNRVVIDNDTYEIDPDNQFFKENESESFTLVAQKIEKEVSELKKEMALRNIDDRSDKKQIAEMLEKAPELAKKNENIKTHMTICLKIIEIIKERKLDDFYQLEKSTRLEDLMNIISYGTDNDIIRLAATLNEDLVQEILSYRKVKSTSVLDYLSKFKDNTFTKNNALYSQVVSGLLGNIKRLMPSKDEVPLYYEIKNIMNCVKNERLQLYDFVDPEGGVTVYEKQIDSIYVVMQGGGVFEEYNSLKRLSKEIEMPIYYGCDKLMNAEMFLEKYEKTHKN